jgi:hypothetical protein
VAKFSILIDNGYSLEYVTTVEAVSAKAARKEFLRKNAGTHYAARVDRDPRNMRATKEPQS